MQCVEDIIQLESGNSHICPRPMHVVSYTSGLASNCTNTNYQMQLEDAESAQQLASDTPSGNSVIQLFNVLNEFESPKITLHMRCLHHPTAVHKMIRTD